ncbi:kremen protein 1-like [Haliotis cracherodii]|uniref:kremen protein 1-like n=1 Tax=Haliotis cracherodii TaxID=6455 RepID=UPI0039EA148E
MDAAYLAALLFLVHVALVEGCGGTYSGSSGDIFSPSYPNDYGVSLSCTYNIVPSAPGSLQLVFVDFETEGGYDYVRLHHHQALIQGMAYTLRALLTSASHWSTRPSQRSRS